MTDRLQQLLRDEADGLVVPPAPASAVLVAGRRRRRGRTLAAAAAAGALTVAVAGAAVGLGGLDRDAPSLSIAQRRNSKGILPASVRHFWIFRHLLIEIRS